MGLFDSILGKVKETRMRNIERRERIRRVEQAMKEHGVKEQRIKVSRKAKLIEKKYGVKPEEALEFVEHEEKQKRRKEFLSRASKELSGLGTRAGTMTASKMSESVYKPRGVSVPTLRSPKKLDPFKTIGKY